jgi:Putative F0F1-ATPase subunit Ca2+/Mg2+ transporter
MQLMITIGLFFAAGFYIDGFFNLGFPIFTLALSFLALGGIFYKLFQELKKNS